MKPTEAGKELFDEVTEDLRTRHVGVVTGPLFGSPALKLSGKAFAFLFSDDMVFKLAGDEHARALALPGAKVFEPAPGRTMKAWVQVPPEQVAEWDDLAERAFSRLAEELGADV